MSESPIFIYNPELDSDLDEKIKNTGFTTEVDGYLWSGQEANLVLAGVVKRFPALYQPRIHSKSQIADWKEVGRITGCPCEL